MWGGGEGKRKKGKKEKKRVQLEEWSRGGGGGGTATSSHPRPGTRLGCSGGLGVAMAEGPCPALRATSSRGGDRQRDREQSVLIPPTLCASNCPDMKNYGFC